MRKRTRAASSERRWATSTGSTWSCGAHAGWLGLTTALCARVGRPTGSATPEATSARVSACHIAHSTSTAAASISAASAPGAHELHGAGGHDGGAGEGGALGAALGEQDLDAVAGQGDRGGQAGGAGADHEDGHVERAPAGGWGEGGHGAMLASDGGRA